MFAQTINSELSHRREVSSVSSAKQFSFQTSTETTDLLTRADTCQQGTVELSDGGPCTRITPAQTLPADDICALPVDIT